MTWAGTQAMHDAAYSEPRASTINRVQQLIEERAADELRRHAPPFADWIDSKVATEPEGYGWVARFMALAINHRTGQPQAWSQFWTMCGLIESDYTQYRIDAAQRGSEWDNEVRRLEDA